MSFQVSQLDETDYPRCADSWDEDEEQENSKTFDNDVLCAVCTQVLLDPLTLRCGHSFCQMCLAQVWHSRSRPPPASIQCPSCRSSWGLLPEINIQLRNLIESVHMNVVKERRGSLLDKDKLVLRDFSMTQTGKSNQRQQERHDVRKVVACLAILFVGLILAMVTMTILAVWVLSGAGGEFMRKPVRQWTNADVIVWLDGLGEWTYPNITNVFKLEVITGSQLLLVTDEALVTFGIESEFRRQTFLQAIEELQMLDYSTPKNFLQFKAAHRKTTLLLTVFYSMWPRFTFLYASLFEYYTVMLPVAKAQFNSHQSTEDEIDLSWKQMAVFAAEILVMPHLAVCAVASYWLPVHPLVTVPLLVHCAIAMFQESLVTYKTLIAITSFQPLAHCRSLVHRGLLQLATFTIGLTVFSLLWPIIPHFICDLIFYLTLWHAILVKLFLSPLNFLLNRRNAYRVNRL